MWYSIVVTYLRLLSSRQQIVTGMHMLYRQTITTHYLSNITINIFRYPFPVVVGMSSTRKFRNIYLNNVQLHTVGLDEYLCECNIGLCIKKKKHLRTRPCELSSHECSSDTLPTRLPANIDLTVKHSIRLRFSVEPSDTSWKNH
jgi:hypothetical protein